MALTRRTCPFDWLPALIAPSSHWNLSGRVHQRRLDRQARHTHFNFRHYYYCYCLFCFCLILTSLKTLKDTTTSSPSPTPSSIPRSATSPFPLIDLVFRLDELDFQLLDLVNDDLPYLHRHFPGRTESNRLQAETNISLPFAHQPFCDLYDLTRCFSTLLDSRQFRL